MDELKTLWFELRIGPSMWQVYLASPRHELLEGEREGFCETPTSSIFINRDLPVDRRPDVFMHELLHAVCFVHGIDTALGQDTAQHEKMVSLLSPLLASALIPFPSSLHQYIHRGEADRGEESPKRVAGPKLVLPKAPTR